jgi:hypothetical protein
MPGLGRDRGDRGAVLPSALIVFSIIVLAVAGVTYFVTRDSEPTEREITTASQGSTDIPSDDATDAEDTETEEPEVEKTKKPKPPIDKSEVGVNVFNNTSIAGLASEVLVQVDDIGWNGLVSDNWYGTIPATTVYYPEGMKREARQLALDLGVQRVQPADVDSDMSTENLTLILTGDLG